jgi:exodeoxyribonuclease VIII
MMKNSIIKNILDNSENEMCYFKKDGQIEKRCRPDAISKNFVFDIKTTRDASPLGFQKSVGSFRYDVQAAWYLDILNLDHFVFVVVENKPPFMSAIYRIDDASVEIGRSDYKKDLEKYIDIINNKEKYDIPSYTNGIETIGSPNWRFYELQGVL